MILKLGLPEKIKALASAPAGIAYQKWSIIEYTFASSPVTGKPVKLTWYDGKKQPAVPENAHPKLKMKNDGCMVVGSAMTAVGGGHAGPPRPIALGDQPYGPEVKELENHWRDELKKLRGHSHYADWIDAAKAGDPGAPGSKFDYSVPLTQAILLGCIALRFPERELIWDAGKARFTNNDEANQWLSFKPRAGFNLKIS